MAARLVIGLWLARASASDELGLRVEWHAPFVSGGGYCSEATAFAEALADANVSITAVPHGDGYSREYFDGLPAEAQARLRALLDGPGGDRARRRRRDERPPLVAVCHSEPGAWHVLRGPNWPSSPCPPRGGAAAYVVGRTMFETDRLPNGWAARLNAVDEVWVPTEWARGVFAAGGVDGARLRVVAEPVDVAYFDPAAAAADAARADVRAALARLARPPATERSDGTSVFLSVFKWEPRKGWDVLLEAWWREFTADDDVLLVLLTSEYHSTADFEAQVDELRARLLGEGGAAARAPAPVRIETRVSHAVLRALYAAARAVVLPTRGEGWGRPHVEAMSMGTPVIATNWSGPTAFLSERNGYPLRFDGLVELPADHAFAGHKWAQPSVAHLQERLRAVVDAPEDARARGRRAREDMVAHFAPDVLAHDVLGHLRRIEASLHVPAGDTPEL